MKLQRDFYMQDDVLGIARDLLGKLLHTCFDGFHTAGLITETEAYAGEGDGASHAYNGKRTLRTQTMYRQGGIAYIYLCYGIHHLFNVVTNREDIPHAVLIRGIYPVVGIEAMEQRTGKVFSGNIFTDGPGKLSKALAIQRIHDGIDLLGERIFIEDVGLKISEEDFRQGPRIGVGYAGEDALLPYRFVMTPEGIKKPPW